MKDSGRPMHVWILLRRRNGLSNKGVDMQAKKVDAIQACVGQKTADEKRNRFGGGILWRILKARDLNAYKEIMIMRKGKEFEKQFKPQNIKQESGLNTSSSMTSTCTSIVGVSDSSQQPSLLQNHLETPKVGD